MLGRFRASGLFSFRGLPTHAFAGSLARTLGSTKSTVRHSSRQCGCAMSLNTSTRHSREQSVPIAHFSSSMDNHGKQRATVMKEQVINTSSQVSASRRATPTPGTGSKVSSSGLPACRARRFRSAWSAAAGKSKDGQLGQRGAACLCSASLWSVAPISRITPLRCGAVLPNPSFKPSPNSVPRRPASAGPAAHCAHAVQRATLSVPA